MTEEMSADTRAILLLCGRLGQTGSDDGIKPLTARKYSLLKRWLKERSMRPADLLSNQCGEQFHEFKVAPLLDRNAELEILAERWTSQGLWVIGRGDPGYPAQCETYLEDSAPAFLFGAGNRELLQAGGLAVVGSREASQEAVEYARRVGVVCAAQGIAVISGGARGIDIQSTAACLEAGGSGIGVLADSLADSAASARYQEGLTSGRLVLVSPYEPEARWLVHRAMERNKLIYGLSDAALVVTSKAGSGGTWLGATEALDCGRVAVYVRVPGDGNRELLAQGASPFPPEPWGDLRALLQPKAALAPPPAADAYSMVLPALLAALSQPVTGKSVEESLGLVPPQAKAWLKRACDEGRVRKLGRPARYVVVEDRDPLFHS